MPRYKLTIAYDGTDFCGWQKQEPYVPVAGEARPPDQVGVPDAIRPGTRAWETSEAMELREGEDRARVALRTVQHVVERAVREIVREPVILMGASRTDAGVHARGQVAAFTCSGEEIGPLSERKTTSPSGDEPSLMSGAPTHERLLRKDEKESARSGDPPRAGGWPLSRGTERLLRALNGRLPEDVQVSAVEVVGPDFDPIRGAVEKAYSYTLHVDPPPPKGRAMRPLWDRRYVHQVWDDLDVAKMREGAKRIVGEHDFAAFAAAGHGRLTTVRTVFSCEVNEGSAGAGDRSWRESEVAGGGVAPSASLARGTSPFGGGSGRRVRIDVSGSGFLYNMVRIIAGTLVEVGRGRMTPDDVSRAIESKDRRNAGPTLPPTGLCLEWVRYAAR